MAAKSKRKTWIMLLLIFLFVSCLCSAIAVFYSFEPFDLMHYHDGLPLHKHEEKSADDNGWTKWDWHNEEGVKHKHKQHSNSHKGEIKMKVQTDMGPIDKPWTQEKYSQYNS